MECQLKRMIRNVAVYFFLLTLPVINACQTNSDRIEGKWKKTSGSGANEQIKQFYSDGRCIWASEHKGKSTVVHGRYYVEGDSLIEVYQSPEVGWVRWKLDFFESDLIIIARENTRLPAGPGV